MHVDNLPFRNYTCHIIFIKTQTFELKKHTLVRIRVFHQLVQENEHLNLEKDFEIVFF